MARDREIGPRVVPIVADESRTFGMEGMFRQLGIYSSVGQLYHPQDAEQLMWYREDKLGQILQEGINEAGAISSWIAAGTSYSNHNLPMIPFYIFYSMFGFQRVGDLAWAAGDSRTRGFLLGATSGRTTLNGEGLQHEDGSSQVAASFIPNCCSYDPTYAYEVAVIMQDGLRRMLADQEDVYYYITLLNENYPHPAMPPDAREGILRGMYLLQTRAPSRQEREESAVRAALRFRRDPARSRGRAPSCSPTTGAFEATSGACPASTSCSATASPRAAGTCCIPRRRRAFRTSSSACADGSVPASPRPTTSAPSPSRSIRSWTGVTSRWGPTVTGAATSAASSAGFSKSTGTSSRWQRSRRSPTTAPSRPATVEKAIKKYGIDPNKPNPITV